MVRKRQSAHRAIEASALPPVGALLKVGEHRVLCCGAAVGQVYAAARMRTTTHSRASKKPRVMGATQWAFAALFISACSSGPTPRPEVAPYEPPGEEPRQLEIWQPPEPGPQAQQPTEPTPDGGMVDGGVPGPKPTKPRVAGGAVRAVGDHLERGGRPFVFQGVNGPAPWGAQYKKHYRRPLADLRFDGIAKMAALGANSMRIVHFHRPEGRLPAPLDLPKTIREVLGHGMVPVLGIWDQTCKTSPSTETEAFWLQGQGASLARTFPQLVVNPYNELNFHDAEKHTIHRAWADYYREFIKKLRAAGIKNLVMIDSGGKCAQNPEGILKYGQEIVEADPLHNVVFSIHLYAYWKTEGRLARWPEGQWRIQDWFRKFARAPFPVVVGEFGGPNKRINADYRVETVMGSCGDGMDGRLFWMDFDGDDKPFYNVYSDLTWSTLTRVGKKVAKWLSKPCTPAR